jgi:DNA-binding response OmpR family regulator
VRTAGDGATGLAMLTQAPPEAAIVDIGLPGIDGYEVARQSRAAGYDGLLIALSGYGQERDIRHSCDAGFDAYLVKPVDATALMRLLVPRRAA